MGWSLFDELLMTTLDRTFLAGAYDTGFIEAEMSGGAGPLSSDLRAVVLAAVAALSARGLEEGGEDEASPVFEVSLPKEDSSRGTVLSSGSPCRVELDGEEIEFELRFDSDPPILATIIAGDSATRAELLPRKKGGYDVGLRDRVLRVKVARVGS
jgi:hypothetical protein